MLPILDLGYGNPAVLQQTLIPFTTTLYPAKTPYFYAKNCSLELREALKRLHQEHGNVVAKSADHIAITVGAVQAIQASLWVLAKEGKKKVYIPRPFWGRFKDFTDLLNLEIVEEASTEAISLITSPNNPNGADQSMLRADIRDACYNWTHYSDSVKKFEDRFVLFSLSKLSGHSSSRIGWVVCQDLDDAKKITEFVNIFTSGVSVEAQETALKSILTTPSLIFQKWKKVLNDRKTTLNSIILTKSLPMRTESTDGMFWYGSADIDFIKSLNIIFVEGKDQFDPENGKVRLNIAVSDEVWDAFLARL